MTREQVEAEIARLVEKFAVTDPKNLMAITIHVWGQALCDEDEPTEEEIAQISRQMARKVLGDTYIKKFIEPDDNTPIHMRRCDGME